MSPFRSQYPSPYHCLGVEATASEAEIRTAYRIRALQLHPDKADTEDREEATNNFQELNTAYEVCLRRLNSPKSAYVEDWECDDDDDDYFEGDLAPGEQPMTGQQWWDELPEDAPLPLRNWAKACKKAHRNSRIEQTETERIILNYEYQIACAQYEMWRRQEEAERDKEQREERIKAELNEREYRNMLLLRNLKFEEGGEDKGKYDYLPDAFEAKIFFEEDEHEILEELLMEGSACGYHKTTDTWRDGTPNKSKVKQLRSCNERVAAATKELATFRRQMLAIEKRESKSLKPRVLEADRVKEMSRNATLKRLEGTIAAGKREVIEIKALREKAVFTKQVLRKLAIASRGAQYKGVELDYRNIDGVSESRLFEEAYIPAEMTTYFLEAAATTELKALEAAPDCGESAVED